MFRRCGLTLGVLVLLSVNLPAAKAEILPTLSLREVTFRADAVVLAELLEWNEPVQATQPGDRVKTLVRFKVTESLKGSLAAGAQISLNLLDNLYNLQRPNWLSDEKAAARPKIHQALLYLGKTEHGYELVLSGMRLTEDGKSLLLPQQMMNPGPYYFVSAKGQNWGELVKRAREEVKTVAAVLAMKDIPDPARRNQAILAWAREHEKGLSGGWFELPAQESKGWGSLAQAVFQWVYDSYRPDDAWEAAKLQMDADVGYAGGLADCFATPKARKDMIGLGADANQPAKYRALALELIAANCWRPGYDAQREHGLSSLDASEQTMLLDALLPLLKDPNESVRAETVRAIANVSMPYDAEGIKKLGSRRALPELVKLYKTDPSDTVRYSLRQALERFEGSGKWQALTQPSR